MISPQAFVEALSGAGVSYFSGVPDSLLKSFCAYIGEAVPDQNHVIATNEGSAVALALGYYLATGKLPLVYMQNSGLGNTINPLVSLADPAVYCAPMLLLIGWRGEPGTRDEPQHVQQGEITLPLLEVLGIPYTVINGSGQEIPRLMSEAADSARSRGGPHALVVRKGSFSKYEISSPNTTSYGWAREAAIGHIVDNLDDRDVVVATTGMASRELYEYRDRLRQGHERDFLTVGGMGHASQIALGLASQKPDRRIVCIDGDGAALMHLGAMAINGMSGLNNFRHIIINNGVHDSVGAQPTVGLDVDLVKVAQACAYSNAKRCDSDADIDRALSEMLNAPGPGFLEIAVDPGHRSDLSRPTSTPQENKQAFMAFVQ